MGFRRISFFREWKILSSSNAARLSTPSFLVLEPSRVEALVSEKIEDALNEIEEIKEVRSTSRESISTISLELRDEVMDGERVWSRIRDRLADVERELPPGGVEPDFDEMDFKAYALLVALKWERPGPVNYACFSDGRNSSRTICSSVKGTEKAELFGEPSEEILVTLDSAQLNALNLNVSDVAAQIRESDSKVSAGQLRGGSEDLLIEVTGHWTPSSESKTFRSVIRATRDSHG